MDSMQVPDYGGRRFGNWLLGRRLGVGTFGAVYQAQNQVIDKQAAVKVLHPHLALNQDQLRRFLGEASAASKASHRGIIDFYDGGSTPDGICYMVMELVQGPSLDQLVAAGPLPPDRVALLGVRLAAALQAVHARGVIHRDLKPENIILLTEDGDALVPKILDFGVAKLRSGPRQTMNGTLLGTLAYMSPEQCETLPDIDHRADIYALGTILYECLTGRLPFNEEAAHGWIYAHSNKEVPPPKLLCPAAPEGLCDVLLRMLAKDPADRPHSMGEVRTALLPFAVHDAPPPRSRAWLLGVAAGVGGLAALGVGWFLRTPQRPPRPVVLPADREARSAAVIDLVPLDGFAASRDQITVGEFHAYVDRTHVTRARPWPWEFDVPSHLPMNNVDAELAARYCQWRYHEPVGRLLRPAELDRVRAALPAAPDARPEEWTTAAAEGKGNIRTAFRCAVSLPRGDATR